MVMSRVEKNSPEERVMREKVLPESGNFSKITKK
jgi:hypothetical protein